jgi:hypothetical protein
MDNDERQSPAQPHDRSWFRELTDEELERALGGMGQPSPSATAETSDHH